MITLEKHIDIRSPQEAVFNAVVDHENLSKWLLPGAKINLIQEGSPERNGLGAIRAIANGPFVGHEEVVAYQAHSKLHYSVIKGLPVRDHLARVSIEALTKNTTRLRWQVQFLPIIPGTGVPIRWVIGVALNKGLSRLGTYLHSQGL